MLKFAFLLKTYEKDYNYAYRLLKSYIQYNVEGIKCFIVLPEKTKNELIQRFSKEEIKDLCFISEESFTNLTREDVGGIKAGYINQEIVKLSFWEMGLCENYCCLDSDAVIIRDFYYSDFMYDEHIPYTVLIEDKDLKVDPVYYKNFWVQREKSIIKIKELIGYQTTKIFTCHGFQNFSAVVLKSFKEEFMIPNKYTYIELMRIAPYEFSWYNIWLQKSKSIGIYPCEPTFKYFHMYHHLVQSWMGRIKKEDLARSYVGIVVNSNYLNGKLIDYEDRKQRNRGIIYGIRDAAYYLIKTNILK